MNNKSSNKNLKTASRAKSDEFYTQLSDIEKELGNYRDHLKNKIIFCNCDDPEESHFWNYFCLNFEHLRLKKSVSTHYEKEKPSYKLEIVKDINNDAHLAMLFLLTDRFSIQHLNLPNIVIKLTQVYKNCNKQNRDFLTSVFNVYGGPFGLSTRLIQQF